MDKKLNIFKSQFGIRANLKNKELEIQKHWQNVSLLKLLKEKSDNYFTLHFGPPYANGSIHIGHALNCILKDFAIRFQNSLGKKTNSQPGWDAHGLPIALIVSKKDPQITNNVLHFRDVCTQFAFEQINKQITQLKRLGLQIDFTDHYQTLSKKYISEELKIFAKIVNKGLIFSSQKPVYWSWSSKTALAETEVEYLFKKSTTAFFLCKIIDKSPNSIEKAFLVWTTTIWTIPENKLLAVDQKAKYLLLEVAGIKPKIIIGKQLLPQLKKELNWKTVKIVKKYLGQDLIKMIYQHPYLKLQSQVVHGDYVSSDEGTGIVHVSPAFGVEDYQLSKKQNIDFNCAIDDNGCFNQFSADQNLRGLFYTKSEPLIIKILTEKQTLVQKNNFNHQYPHDWRTKKPVIYRTTPQWYLNLKPLQEKITKIINQIEWMPQWGKKRMQLILAKRTDWCLSRQRSWGVPIPIFVSSKKEPVLIPEIINHIANLVAIHGDSIWWKWTIKQLLTKEQINKYQIISKLTDTLDVWFDSGCSATIVEKGKIVDIIWEGNDQYRGWFNSLIIISAALENKFPIKKILTHGFVNDEKGKKMSKSLGNVVNPNDVCQNLGADVLRLWVTSGNYFEDLNLSSNLLDNVAKSYTKIRNTIRFLVNNLVDFEATTDTCQTFTVIDQWILIKLNALINKTHYYFTNYSYHLFYLVMINFLTVDLSQLYFDYAKNILYTEHPQALSRRQIQTTFAIIIKKLLPLLAPILVHTTEEVYQIIKCSNKQTSIHLEKWPKPVNLEMNDEQQLMLMTQTKFIADMKLDINKILEKAVQQKTIKRFAEAEIRFSYNPKYQLFTSNKDYQKFLNQINIDSKYKWKEIEKKWQKYWYQKMDTKNLALFLQVHKIIFTSNQKEINSKTGFIELVKKNGVLCSRCFLKFIKANDTICQNCQEVIKAIKN